MAGARHETTAVLEFRAEAPREAVLGDLAERQHGVVTLAQLRSLGLSGSAVWERAAGGRLRRVHRQVYAVGRGGLTEPGRWMAAVLAYGPDGVLSHRDAAALHGLRGDRRAGVDVTVPRRARGRLNVEVHVSRTLRPADVVVRERISCTSVARTLVDLGDVLSPRAVERAVEQAEILHSFDLKEVEKALARAGPRRGAGVLRAVLRELGGPTATKRELEERFLAVCRGASLPQPAVNDWLDLGGTELQVDFLWRAQRLIVETDGRATHATRQAFERDRRRDQQLTLAGYTVVRFTHRQLADESDRVAHTIAALLAR
jgi:predicted transcriptional regulator of viral defense system